MTIAADKVETHETAWRGALDSDQLDALLLDALKRGLGIPHYEPGLDLLWKMDTEAGKLVFTITKDHLSYLKPVAEARA